MAPEPFKLPNGHTRFSEESNKMSLDSSKRLHWNGQMIKTETKLPFIASAFGFIVSMSAVVAATATVFQAIYAYKDLSEPEKPVEVIILENE